MAFALSGRNLAFIEDLYINETAIETPADLQRALEKASAESAHNCWVAVGLYIATLVISIHQFWLNNRGITARYQRQLWNVSNSDNVFINLFRCKKAKFLHPRNLPISVYGKLKLYQV